jgi:hypothetical protein
MAKNIVVVDIDGTISKVGDRLKYLQQNPTNWDSFYESCFEDDPIIEIVELVKHLEKKYQILYCTGRRESVRKITVNWIDNFIGSNYIAILMRPNGDKRHDTEVKPEMLNKFGIELDNVAFVLEDRNSMVNKWRELGLKCLQVADGDF